MRSLKNYGLILCGAIILIGIYFYSNDVINQEVELINYNTMKSKNYSISDNLIKLDFDIVIEQGIPSIGLQEGLGYISKNPWNEYRDIDVMSVFINKDYNLRYHGDPIRSLNERQSIEVYKVVADKLGLDKKLYETHDYGSGHYVYFPKKEEYIIKVEPNADNIRIFISENTEVINKTLPNIKNKNEDLLQEKYMEYFYNEYKNLLGTNQPIFEAKYNWDFNNMKTYVHKIFNQEEFIEDTIINYSLNSNYLSFDNQGVKMITLSYKQLAESMKSEENSIVEKVIEDNELEVVGYYPLISREQVIEKILKKDFVSSIDYIRDVKLEDILSVELVYYNVPVNKTIMPVYKAYIDLEDALDDGYVYETEGLKQYGIFYLPAIEEEYVNIIFE